MRILFQDKIKRTAIIVQDKLKKWFYPSLNIILYTIHTYPGFYVAGSSWYGNIYYSGQIGYGPVQRDFRKQAGQYGYIIYLT